MGLNFYSTRVSVTPAQDPDVLTQGLMVFLTSTPATPIIAYMHVKYEFQTLEDPSFLAKLVNKDDQQKQQDQEVIVVPPSKTQGGELWH
jgi:hypothetical protein